jgi:hypothetical protein
MPVIVNELEVVTETQVAPPQPTPSGETAAPQAAPPPVPTLGPEELIELLRHREERLARLSDC